MTTTYTFDQLKEDVRKEAEALKQHATKEERERLSMIKFSPSHYDGCIYGLCTGDCFSDRATELIAACCVRYFHNNSITSIKREGFKGVVKRVNGATVEDLKSARKFVEPKYYSAIEAYILLPEAKNANIISYLRGETETLEL